jgi:DNA-binding NarL/FixJ family response regulator
MNTKPQITPPALPPALREVWRRVADDQPSKQIASELGISLRTVDHQREELYRRLGCSSGIKCARLAIRWGVVREPVLLPGTQS